MKKFLIIAALQLSLLNTLRATIVQLADASTLNQELYDAGFEDLINQTTIIEELANKKLDVEEIVRKILGFIDFYKIIAEEYLSSQVQIEKRKIIEILIGDNDEAIKELNKYDLN